MKSAKLNQCKKLGDGVAKGEYCWFRSWGRLARFAVET